jgi:hypothetical protein
MNVATITARPAAQRGRDAAQVEAADTPWAPFYRVAGVSALAQVALIAIQIPIFILRPPPETIEGWFALYERNPFLGFLNLDGLMLVNGALMFPILIALYMALRPASAPLMALAATLGVVANALGFVWNASLTMLAFSDHYAAAATEAERAAFLAAGQSLLTNHISGTAFVAYYLLSSATVLIIGAVMLRSTSFGKATAYAAILAGLLTLLPPTEDTGTIGLVVSVISLVPMAVWFILVARGLFRLRAETSRVPGA